MTKLAFELSSISNFDICILQSSGICGVMKHAEAPVLAAGFLQLFIVDTLGELFSMWFSKFPRISDAESFASKLLSLDTLELLYNL
jgi:hypothetical protein